MNETNPSLRLQDRPDPDPPEPQPAGRVRARLISAGIVVLLLIGSGTVVRLPLHSLGPGPPREVQQLISVEGAEVYPSQGQMLLMTANVSGAPINVWEYLWTIIDPNLRTAPRRTVVLPGLSDDDQRARHAFDMEESKVLALLAAFEALDLDVERLPGARVISVIDGGPSDGVLEPRDVIRTIGGIQVDGPTDAVAAIRSVQPGDTVRLTVARAGTEEDIEVTTQPARDDPERPVIGAFLGDAYRFPYDVTIDSDRVGGPSGGLVFALALVDLLTPDDLSKGHVIAATGTIERAADGTTTIGRIGAIPEKVRAARAAGATVFMLPAGEADEARRLVPEGMIVIGVETLADAIEALRALPAA